MSLNSALQRASKAIEEIVRTPVPEDDAPDVIGRLRQLSRKLLDAAKALESETVPGVVGQRFESVSKSKPTKRSYSDSAIFSSVMETPIGGKNLLQAIRVLRDADALRLTWRWTELVDFFSKNDLRMMVEAHEILDGDVAHVGEVRDKETKVVEIEDGPEVLG